MKITMTSIEASAEDLRASRTLADTVSVALGRIANAIAGPIQHNFDVEEEEEDAAEKDDTDC